MVVVVVIAVLVFFDYLEGYWCCYLSGARCRFAYGPADATATHCLCFSKIQIGFTFLILAYPGNPIQSRGCKMDVRVLC